MNTRLILNLLRYDMTPFIRIHIRLALRQACRHFVGRDEFADKRGRESPAHENRRAQDAILGLQ